MSRRAVYDARAADPDFAAAWDDAQEEGTDLLEAEARRRAVEGVLEPVFQGGAEVGYVRKYSDSLLTLLLKSKRSVFRDRVAVDHGGKVQHEHAGALDLRLATDEELAALEALAARAEARS